MAALLTLFFSSLLAATLLPLSSEALLASLLSGGRHNTWQLIAVATTGNTLGSVINWMIGRSLYAYRHHKWFPFKPREIDKAQRIFNRYGLASLLFAWLPLIGDPLTLVAGLLRVNLVIFVVLVATGKLGRYLLIAGLF